MGLRRLLKEGEHMNIALVGCGGVGKAFLELLRDKEKDLRNKGIDLLLKYVISSRGGVYCPEGIVKEDFLDFMDRERDITRYPKGGSTRISFDNIIANKDIDMLIELTPTNKETGEPGLMHITRALENGIHVVTGNKGPIITAYKRLKELARDKRVQLAIGCTTGGALPSINAGMIDLAGSKILAMEGILNGTTNFIIQEMEEKNISYSEALKNAQELGIAEADPSLDIDGWDTAIKMLILINVLMDEELALKDARVSGISGITRDDIKKAALSNNKLKLIGRAIRKVDKLELCVALEEIAPNHPLYGVDGKNKGIKYVSDTLGDLTIIGGASGTKAAAASVLRDVINIHKGYKFV